MKTVALDLPQYLGILCINICVIYMFVPETKGLTLEVSFCVSSSFAYEKLTILHSSRKLQISSSPNRPAWLRKLHLWFKMKFRLEAKKRLIPRSQRVI